MKQNLNHIFVFLFMALVLSGTLFLVPSIFVNRFTTGPVLWMQVGISIGLLGYVLLKKKRIHVPPKGFLLLMIIWTMYHTWHNLGNIENMIAIITFIVTFFIFYVIWKRGQREKILFVLLTILGFILSLWGLGQIIRILPSNGNLFIVTGPFDNPAGISAVLVALLPFSLCCSRYLGKKYRVFGIIITCFIIVVIILSHARTAMIATVFISIFYFLHLLKEQNVKLLSVHYISVSISCILLFAGLFFVKKDSSNGRLLIWQCSTELMSHKPVFGHGGNGFMANYMYTQASYFVKHPDSKYVMLADNIRHPFNEFLKWGVNYGIVGLCLTLLLIIVPLCFSWNNDSPRLFFIRLSLLSIGVCSLFSYPFNYPFIRLMTAMLLAFLLAAHLRKNTTITNGYLLKGVALLLSIGLLCVTIYQAIYEREWHVIAHKSLRGQTVQMLPQYEMIYTHLRYKDMFLYNYAAELNISGQYEKSLRIARECDGIWADYDLQMLIADNCLQLEQYSVTESCLKKATEMCPVKFMPLYQLVELYLQTGEEEKARELAQEILDKQVKIASPVINSIKNKMRKLLIEPYSFDDPSQLIESDIKPTNTLSWQDCFLDLRTPRALLPT